MSPALEAICSKALANDVAGRYPTALAFRDAILEYLGEHEDNTDLGRALATSFAAERSHLHAVIDAQVKAARETSSGGARTMRQIPLLGPEPVSGTDKSVMRGGLSVESDSDSLVSPVASRSRGIALAGDRRPQRHGGDRVPRPFQEARLLAPAAAGPRERDPPEPPCHAAERALRPRREDARLEPLRG